MSLALVWAQTADGVIGRDGTLPWHLPEDLARFRRLTAGHAVVMGRRTWESLPERMRPLPDRRNVVLSRDPAYRAAGAQVCSSLEAALDLLGADEEVWVIGGAALFAEAITRAGRLEVTDVDLDVPGDTYAPPVDPARWRPVAVDGDQPLEAALAHGQALDAGPWLVSRTGTRYRFRSYTRADASGAPGTGAVA
ncbi:dihydrofolate reductase [Cellulomonas sp. SG140]|uniref:dihydrofolate reductase n=1 Tax=Cellulomonas sp. SG140 TaxID=2976536 RepID=UPI0021E7B169|nr:dihydrofolate reductase [Cellulomonas sp. SG140]